MDFTKQRQSQWKPLEDRTYRYKKSAIDFFCPLCRTQRTISMGHKLTALNYIQIFLLTCVITALSYPWGGFRGLVTFFIIWPAFEMTRRSLFKREVPCPHCGFDASWYKRDVKIARQKVADFWEPGETDVAHVQTQGEAQEMSADAS